MRRASSRTADEDRPPGGPRRARAAPARRGPASSAQATRGSGHRPRGPAAVQVEDDQVVAVDDLAGEVLGEVLGAPPDPLGPARGRAADEALGEHRAVGADDLHRVVGPEGARDRHHARRRAATGPRRPGPAGPRRRPPASRPSGRAKAIQSLRAPSRTERGPEDRARPRPRRPRRRASTPGRSPSAMTASTPDQVAILAAASLEAMPPLPHRGARAPGHLLEAGWSISTTSSMREASSTRPGVGGEQARRCRSGAPAGRRRPGGPPGRPAGRCRRSGSPRRPPASFSLTTGTTPSSSRWREGPAGVQVLLAVARSRAGPAGPARPAGRGGRGRPARSA